VLHSLPFPPSLFGLVILFGEEYKLRSSSLWYFLHSPTISSPYGRNVPFSTLILNSLSIPRMSLLLIQRQSFTPMRNYRQNYVCMY
jgi:hypothetical protein